jgi:hypothetical protein
VNVVDEKRNEDFEEAEDNFVRDTFLDSEYSIKEEVHEIFRRYSFIYLFIQSYYTNTILYY